MKKNQIKQKQFTLTEVRDKIWLVTCKKQYDLAMLFLRSQEYYESPKFRYTKFTLVEFMNWYATQSSEQSFTYPQDWSGFNIPSWTITEAVNWPSCDMNYWDDQMLEILWYIDRGADDDLYLIGALEGDQETINHELAHGLFYTNKEYQKTMKKLVAQLPERKEISAVLKTMDGGYHHSVFVDETQAYLATGLEHPDLRKFRVLQKPFIKVFDEAMHTR